MVVKMGFLQPFLLKSDFIVTGGIRENEFRIGMELEAEGMRFRNFRCVKLVTLENERKFHINIDISGLF